MMNESQLADTAERGKDAHPTIPLSECDDLSMMNTETIDINHDFLELDDNEFKGVDKQPLQESENDAPEDEFVSTVFVTTLDGKKKLL